MADPASRRTYISLIHRTTSRDFRYHVSTTNGATETLVFQSEVFSADGDVHEIIQTGATGDVVIKVNGVTLWSGNIPLATVPDRGRYGMAGTSGASDVLYDGAGFAPA